MTNVLFAIFAFVVVLGVVVFVHESGHFLAAKLFRVRVEVFSLGFGPRVLGFRRGDTDYRLSALPLGGYVRMAGEFGGEDTGPQDDGFFTAKKRWQRVGILLAGPAMNVVLSLVLWWGLFMYGSETLDIPQGPPVVEATEPGSPAELAGLRAGDRIVDIAGRPITSVEDHQETILLRPGKTVTYRVERDGTTLSLDVTLGSHAREGIGWDGVRPRMPIMIEQVVPKGPAARAGVRPGDRILELDGHVPSGIDGVRKLVEASVGEIVLTVERNGQPVEVRITPEAADKGKKIGVVMNWPRKFVQYGPVDAAVEALRQAQRNAGFLFRTLSALVRRDVGLEVMSGPLEIARFSKDQVQAGLLPLLSWLAFISIQLGIFNLLPVPVLDGGHILILLIESVLRRDMPMVFKERVLQVGFVLLIAFAAVVLFGDVRKMLDRREAETKSPPAVTAPAR